MARYNTSSSNASINGATTINSPNAGLLTNFTGTAPYTVTLPSPVLYSGIPQFYYNATSGVISVVTPSGIFTGASGSGSTSLAMPATTTLTIVSDGANYVVTSSQGGPLLATTGSFSSTLSATAAVTMNPSNANVSIQPTGTGVTSISSGTVGSIVNMNVGTSSPGSGAFTSLTANGQGSFTASTISTNSSTGALTVTGGLGVGGAVNLGGTLAVATSIAIGGSATIKNADGLSGATDARLLFGNTTSNYAALRMVFNSTTCTSIDSVSWGSSSPETILSFQTNGGKVAIGSATSNYILGVQGNIGTTGITISTGGGTNVANTVNIDTDGSGIARYYSHGSNSSSPGGHAFHLASSDGSIDNIGLYIAPNGTVGIGNNSPNDLLYVDNNSASSTAGITLASSGTTDARIYANGGNLVVNSLRTNPIYFQVNGNTYLTLMGNGNLAVNSTTTSYNLGVNGTIGSSSITTNYVYGTNRKEFNFGFSNSQVWFYIGYLPPSNGGTGDAMAIEITGIVSSINGKGRVKLGLGQRGGFWYSKSLEGNNPQVHCQVYNQADGSSRVWIYNSSLSYPAAEIIYYTYGWGGQNGVIQNASGCTIYDVTSYQTTTPGGTLIFDSSNYSSYPVNEGLSVGALSKTSGSFRINHPLPALTSTHELVHSFIEGPKADLIYRGTVNLENGAATVDIDNVSTMTEGTFEVLCRDVQCFVNNTTGWDSVRGSVTGNILTIICQNTSSTDTVSWMVIGERKDPHMYETDWTDEEGHVIVEPLKEIIVAPPPEPYDFEIGTEINTPTQE